MKKIAFAAAGIFVALISFGIGPVALAISDGDVVNDDSGTKTLILLRHAKSDKSNMNIPDISRPLEESGRKEAREQGEFLRDQQLGIDLIISSPSIRTRQTLEIICPLIGYDYEKVIWDSTLYACSGEHLLSKVRKPEIEYHTIMYVGHNPSITVAANELQSSQKIDEVKTCGLVAIDFNTGLWSEVAALNGTLRFYAKPK